MASQDVEAEVTLTIKFGDREATSKQVRTISLREGRRDYDALDNLDSMVHDANTEATNEVLK